MDKPEQCRMAMVTDTFCQVFCTTPMCRYREWIDGNRDKDKWSAPNDSG